MIYHMIEHIFFFQAIFNTNLYLQTLQIQPIL